VPKPDYRLLALVSAGALCASAIAGGAGPTSPAATAAPSEASPPPLLSAAFTQPVISSDFPDPFVLRTATAYYAMSTNAGGQNVPLSSSTDLVNWQYLGDAMPVLAPWVATTNVDVWAPEAMQVKGGYALYYTARTEKNALMCIGVATSAKPEGPYQDQASEPLVCQEDQGGSIDASPFIDKDGQRYLYWKNDGNCCGMATWIWVQKVSPEGTRLIGERRQLFYNSNAWEGGVIEAPNTVLRDGRYYLFYSSGRWDSPFYSVGYAVANSPMGPFRKVSVEGPLVETMSGPVLGAGHQGITTDGAGRSWFYYHGWADGEVGYPNGRRAMFVSPIEWVGGRAVVGFTWKRQGTPTPLGAR
jgi:beta-xylosidase